MAVAASRLLQVAFAEHCQRLRDTDSPVALIAGRRCEEKKVFAHAATRYRRTMKALVKSRSEAGLWLEDIPSTANTFPTRVDTSLMPLAGTWGQA